MTSGKVLTGASHLPSRSRFLSSSSSSLQVSARLRVERTDGEGGRIVFQEAWTWEYSQALV